MRCSRNIGSGHCVCRPHQQPHGLSVLNGSSAGFFSPDTDGLLQFGHKDFAITDLAGFCGLGDGFDNLVQQFVANGDFHFHFWKKVDNVLCTTVKLGMALLTTETFYFQSR